MNQTLIFGIKEVVTVASKNLPFLRKENAKLVSKLLDNEENLAILIDNNGLIKEISKESSLLKQYENSITVHKINAKGGCVIPGFVDAHTHPVFAGDRVHEFSMKLAGASYMDIHKAGGGIYFTVNATSLESEENLYSDLKERLIKMLAKGTTTVECKTGYGLVWETEEKMLKVITRAKRELPLDISITFLSAHALPKGKTADEATRTIVNEHIPKLKNLIERKEVEVDNIDVFCEKGVFNVEQTELILKAGQSIGLNVNFHADELNSLGGAELAARLNARAASHLEEISDNGISQMTQSNTAAVLLPTTAYILRLRPPPARKMLDEGVIVALGSDFNPNAHCWSMPIVMHLACVLMNLSLEEALTASTINSAYALGLSHKLGSLEVGKQADLVIISAPRWEHLVYQLGEADNLISHVIKRGRLVYEQQPSINHQW